MDAGGRTKVVRRYAMGRLAAELAHVIPDERTVYMGDDGRDVVFFMFIADKPRDLSAGTLYAARWEQSEAANGGKSQSPLDPPRPRDRSGDQGARGQRNFLFGHLRVGGRRSL